MMPTDDTTATGVDTFRQDLRLGSAEPQPGDTLGGRFLLRSILGSGSTGTVYAAVDTTVGQKVAIKLLHPHLRDTKTRERLRREVRASRPGHPNIVSVFDLHESDGHLYLSMALVEGKALRTHLAKHGELPAEQVIEIGRHTASALEHLHSKGLVHRDVKPGNILISRDSTVKLCDMGLTRPLEEGVTVTATEMVVGTPSYMAPEQATGTELCSASDIYALGLTLYQALTGEVPLKETTAIATLSRRQRERPAPIRREQPSCPRWLDRLIRRMLEPKPHERPSASEVFRALDTRRLLPRPRRRTVAATVAVLFLVVAAAAGARLLTRHPTTTVDVGKLSITGKDNRGRQTWTREFDIPIVSDQRADIDGDGREEILLILAGSPLNRSRSETVAGPEIWILRDDNSVMSHFLPEQEIIWDFDYGIEIQVSLLLLDIDHDSTPEVVMVGDHQNFFPSVIFVYRVASNTWHQVLTHPGNFRNVRATPPQSDPGLRFIAVNNRLGVLGFAGEIHIKDQGSIIILDLKEARRTSGLHSPPLGPMQPTGSYSWGAYVPLPLDDGTFVWSSSEVVDSADGGFELRTPGGEKVIFDSFWNPTPGPNAGKDLRTLRRAFMDELFVISPQIQKRTPESIAVRRSAALKRFADLLLEPAYSLLLDLKSARALARTDNLDAARDILRHTVETTRQRDAIYRLAHFEALAGSFGDGSKLLLGMMSTSGNGAFATRAVYDGPQLLLRIGIEDHSLTAIEAAVSQLSAHGAKKEEVRIGQALMARAHLWWDQLQPEDLEVTSWSYAPAGEAIACLARWRNGASREDEIEAMDTFIERNPDAAFEGRLARTTALLGAGRNTEALDEITVLTQQLVYPSKDDFANHQLLDLAKALRVVALEADGQIDRALLEGAELIPTLMTPNLLPAILVSEVLDRSGRG